MDKVLLSSDRMDWETPQDLFDELNERYHFTIDVAASDSNHKCDRYYTPFDDGLMQEWAGERVFCNPPYGRQIGKWVHKCYVESSCAELIVLLMPARTDTAYFHEWILGHAKIEFLRGRLRFETDGVPSGCAPFPSMLVKFEPKEEA